MIAREIRISSNAGGSDRARIFEFARMWEEEIAREDSNLLECWIERSCGRFEFALMVEGEIVQ